ncbi:extracellular solute-binding protein [Mycolicibacterium sp. 624]|uniref:ABC transporter substrate-binding protein n=1 Tax=Mycolicibacterium sp. 624 TaxID=3156314 RepID=UPI0033993E06
MMKPVALALAALTLFTAGCGGGDDTPVGAGSSNPGDPASITGTIRLFSYEDGYDPDYMASFKEQYPNITLDTASFGSNEEAIAKVKSGFTADVINTCVDEAALEAVEADVYAPLDTSRLENWDKIWPAMKEMPGVTYDGQFFVVPVDAGTAGLMYNADKITTPPTSWNDLFDPKYKSRASLQDNAVTAIDIGALATGITDPLNIDAGQLESVKQFLISNRGNFRTWWADQGELITLFKTGEIDIASGYTNIQKDLESEGLNVKFATAKEGQMLWTCGYGISPKIKPENVDAAYALLNWYTSLPAQVWAATNWNYMGSNEGIVEAVTPEVREDAALDTLFNLDDAIPAAPPKDRDAWIRAWAQVKAS